MNIRNIAIIAHVDHGKTTLVDQLLKKSETLSSRENLEERAMDNNDITLDNKDLLVDFEEPETDDLANEEELSDEDGPDDRKAFLSPGRDIEYRMLMDLPVFDASYL